MIVCQRRNRQTRDRCRLDPDDLFDFRCRHNIVRHQDLEYLCIDVKARLVRRRRYKSPEMDWHEGRNDESREGDELSYAGRFFA
jgi:hypothetical protein